jgi:hypothetical protein
MARKGLSNKERSKKPERKRLEAALDKVVSQIVIARDGRCVTCGTTEGLTCSHLIVRGKRLLRWDLTNCNCMCFSCNFRHNNFPHFYTRWFIKFYGLDIYEQICDMGNVPAWKWNLWELEDMLAKLTKIRDSLGNGKTT